MKKLSDSQKVQIAIEALEYFKKYSNDSRNWGLISTKIDRALKQLTNKVSYEKRTQKET